MVASPVPLRPDFRYLAAMRTLSPALVLLATLLAAWLQAAPAPAADSAASTAVRLSLPVACTPDSPDTACYVQNHFDHDPGPGRADFACGPLTYDGHRGTDFAVPDLAAMDAGMPVLAAADGVVAATREGVEDTGIQGLPEEDRDAMALGNAVILDHGNGLRTTYGHLRKGSVAVRSGDAVRAGDVLGMVGMSGLAEFPHVHFGVFLDGRPVDPYTGDAGPGPCGDTAGALWSPRALAALAYRPTGLLGAGFTSAEPSGTGLMQGRHHAEFLSPTAPALIFWTRLFGLRAGDVLRMRLLDPDGRVLARREITAESDKVLYFQYIGKKRGPGLLPPGRYKGHCTLLRARQSGPLAEILRAEADVTIR